MKKSTLYLFSIILINIIFTSCGESTNKINTKTKTQTSLDDNTYRYYDNLTEKEPDSISKIGEGKGVYNLTNEELKVIKRFNKWKDGQNYISNAEKARNRDSIDSIAEVAVNGKNMVKLIEDIIDEAEIELTRQKIKKIDRKLLLDNVLNNVVGKWQIATAQEMPILMKNKLKIRILKDPKFDELVKKFGEE
jgi:signal transduction histidine kinase